MMENTSLKYMINMNDGEYKFKYTIDMNDGEYKCKIHDQYE